METDAAALLTTLIQRTDLDSRNLRVVAHYVEAGTGVAWHAGVLVKTQVGEMKFIAGRQVADAEGHLHVAVEVRDWVTSDRLPDVPIMRARWVREAA